MENYHGHAALGNATVTTPGTFVTTIWHAKRHRAAIVLHQEQVQQAVIE